MASLRPSARLSTRRRPTSTASRRPATTSVQSLPPATSTATGSTTSRSGSPARMLGGTPDTGLVYILQGVCARAHDRRRAIAASGRRPASADASETGDRFGGSLAVGDFDADNTSAGRPVDDSRSSVPGEDFNNRTRRRRRPRALRLAAGGRRLRT